METQRAICPNCGAHTTNTQNCEFCGSLLTRLQQHGVNIESSVYKDDGKIFKGLINALKRNLELQEMVEDIAVGTAIYTGDELLCSVGSRLVSEHGEVFFPSADYSKKHLMIVFNYKPNNISGDELRLHRFRNLDIYELFTELISFNNGVKCYEYAIDFGADAEGAALLISRILYEVCSIPYETTIDCYTGYLNRGGENITVENNEEFSTATAWWIVGVVLAVFIMVCLATCE